MLNAIGRSLSVGLLATSRIALRTWRFPMKPLGHIVSDMSSTTRRHPEEAAAEDARRIATEQDGSYNAC
jgi:hypothetical protein